MSPRYVFAACAALFVVSALDAAVAGARAAQGAAKTASVWDGVYTEEQSRNGSEVSKASCVSCHGDELVGSDLAPALFGDDFKAAWNGKTAAELYEKIHTTMPADRIGTLKPQQSADLVAYIFKQNDFPAGTAALAPDQAALAAIVIRSRK